MEATGGKSMKKLWDIGAALGFIAILGLLGMAGAAAPKRPAIKCQWEIVWLTNTNGKDIKVPGCMCYKDEQFTWAPDRVCNP